MFGLGIGGIHLLDLQWQGTLSDYVRAIAWSPTSDTLAASSAAGEVILWHPHDFLYLQKDCGVSVDSIAFCADGQFLAAGGQDGQVKIWQFHPEEPKQTDRSHYHDTPISTSEQAYKGDGYNKTIVDQPIILSPVYMGVNGWIEHLAWNPSRHQLAFSLGRSVQIWDADIGEMTATLNFEASSVLGLQWRPDGQYLAVCGHRGVKVWNAQNWDEPPYLLDIRAASIAIAWSPNGHYLASGNMDRTLTVLEWNKPDPWVMRGFSSKIRTVTWSEPLSSTEAPLLAASCAQSITVWEKQADESVGWDAQVLELHEGIVQALAFQPGTFLLASAAADGYVCLWQDAEQVAQILEGTPSGFSHLAWHPQSQKLAGGGQNGELFIWSGC